MVVRRVVGVAVVVVAAVCAGAFGQPAEGRRRATLAEVRKGFKTELPAGREQPERVPVPAPPEKLFRVVKYPSAVGALPAYVSVAPQDGKKRPAIVWITGGDCNSIGEVWEDAPPENDQTARAFRDAGVVMMFPALRGGNDGPGRREGFLGEVDDVIAAADFLAKQPGVDAERIYLGGHSTGGTLALLVAECAPRFRAVFAFGPVHTPAAYGADAVAFDVTKRAEVAVRSPILWLADVTCPTFVIEGEEGNVDALRVMKQANRNPAVRFIEVKGADHFNVLRPVQGVLAKKILGDAGKAFEVTEVELAGAGKG